MATILVIEDSSTLCKLYKLDFEQDGYDVVIAQDMMQSLWAFGTYHPDVVVLGIRMPTMDGLEAMQRVLGHDRNVRLVINSGSASYSNNFLNWAADAYLLKSSDTSELRSTIRNLLRERQEQAGSRDRGAAWSSPLSRSNRPVMNEC
jgi:DNA-binding response OmpR family regulator